MNSISSSGLYQVVSFCLVGAICTVVTLVLIYLLMFWGISLVTANFTGYAVGIAVNFLLNSRVTFEKKISAGSFCRFLAAALFAYLVNLGVVLAAAERLPGDGYAAQLAGMFFYTAVNFLLNRFWVMTQDH